MSEEFGFNEFGRDGGAVDLDHRGIGASRLLMDQAGNDFFAGTVLSGDEHARLGGCYLIYYLAYARYSSRFTDHLRTRGTYFLAQLFGFLTQGLGLQGILGSDQDPVEVKGLEQKIVRAYFEGLYGGFHIAMSGDHDHGSVDGFFAGFEGGQQFDAVHFGHFDIGEDEVVGFGLYHFESYLAVFGNVHIVSLICQNLFEGVADTAFVVYDQDFCHNSPIWVQSYDFFLEYARI